MSIKSIANLIDDVKKQLSEWEDDVRPWFRGEPEHVSKPLWPKVFRRKYNENQLLQRFRMQAPSLGLQKTPPRDNTDEWLFLAQHFGLPTRLLDWTEGLLFALYFALYHRNQSRYGSAIWMLNPIELNRCSYDHLEKLRDDLFMPPRDKEITREDIEMELAWFTRELDTSIWMQLYWDYEMKSSSIKEEKSFLSYLCSKYFLPNLANMNVRAAWETRYEGTKLPIALLPSYVDTRMAAQRSRFTIHGKLKGALKLDLGRKFLVRFVIDKARTKHLKKELSIMGVEHSMIYPDLKGLAKELRELF